MDGSSPRSRRRGLPVSRRPRLVPEVLLLVGLFLIYRLGRLAITGHDDLAIDNAWHVWDLRAAAAVPRRGDTAGLGPPVDGLVKGANWYYVAVHFPATLAFLAWGWLRRPPEEYRWARRLIITLTRARPAAAHRDAARPAADASEPRLRGHHDRLRAVRLQRGRGDRLQPVRRHAEPARRLGPADRRGRDPHRQQPLALGDDRAPRRSRRSWSSSRRTTTGSTPSWPRCCSDWSCCSRHARTTSRRRGSGAG